MPRQWYGVQICEHATHHSVIEHGCAYTVVPLLTFWRWHLSWKYMFSFQQMLSHDRVECKFWCCDPLNSRRSPSNFRRAPCSRMAAVVYMYIWFLLDYEYKHMQLHIQRWNLGCWIYVDSAWTYKVTALPFHSRKVLHVFMSYGKGSEMSGILAKEIETKRRAAQR